MTSPEPSAGSTERGDAGIVRAGAATAARRRALNISQRSLAADGVINAGVLIDFEKGRSWPRERTRAKLEEVLRWPSGTIARIRHGEPIAEPERPAAPPTGVEAPLLIEAIQTAVNVLDEAIDLLPESADPAFTQRVAGILANLRHLEAAGARAVRTGAVTPPVLKALSAVRTRYDRLMLRAATAPQPTLGQRLYAVRRGANLTIAETAQAAGVADGDVAAAEAEEPLSPPAAAAIEALIAELG